MVTPVTVNSGLMSETSQVLVLGGRKGSMSWSGFSNGSKGGYSKSSKSKSHKGSDQSNSSCKSSKSNGSGNVRNCDAALPRPIQDEWEAASWFSGTSIIVEDKVSSYRSHFFDFAIKITLQALRFLPNSGTN